jgi:hypothetical protein
MASNKLELGTLNVYPYCWPIFGQSEWHVDMGLDKLTSPTHVAASWLEHGADVTLKRLPMPPCCSTGVRHRLEPFHY